jgi:hypothetical protein
MISSRSRRRFITTWQGGIIALWRISCNRFVIRNNISSQHLKQTPQVVEASNGTDKLSGRVLTFSGRVLTFPGAPDMYDHERHAYAAGPPLAGILTQGQKLAGAVDGFIVTTSLCLEPVRVPFCREVFGKKGKELFAVGIQAHELCWTDSAAVVPSNKHIRSFLDRAVREYGLKSVLYNSFG